MDNANKILFRASANGKLMPKPRLKSETLSQTTKTHLIELFDEKVYGRVKDINSKYLEKGLSVEESALTLYSRVTKTFHAKNEEYFNNDYVCGTPDIITEDRIIDIKSSWDLSTFRKAQHDKINPIYYWQLLTYMWLTGKQKATLAYCLVNSTSKIINDEKRKVSYNCNSIDLESDPEYIEKCKQIEVNHIFDINEFVKENPAFDFHIDPNEWSFDIPMKKRVHTIDIELVKEDAERLVDKIVECREWMNANLF
jgi:hypothetical protein